MPTLVGRIFSGHLRSIIGSMTVEAIIREQQTLADAIVEMAGCASVGIDRAAALHRTHVRRR